LILEKVPHLLGKVFGVGVDGLGFGVWGLGFLKCSTTLELTFTFKINNYQSSIINNFLPAFQVHSTFGTFAAQKLSLRWFFICVE
jgi:hypothetical protein